MLFLLALSHDITSPTSAFTNYIDAFTQMPFVT